MKRLALPAALLLFGLDGCAASQPQPMSALDLAHIQLRACIEAGRDCAAERAHLAYEIELAKLVLLKRQTVAAETSAAYAGQRNAMAIYTYYTTGGWTGGW